MKGSRAFFYIPDDAYIPANYNALDMAEFYRCIYPGFQQARFETMMKQFHLDGKRKSALFPRNEETASGDHGNQYRNEISVL